MLSHTGHERVVRAAKWYAPWLRNAFPKVTGLRLVRLDDVRSYTNMWKQRWLSEQSRYVL